jgi:hypothetical protein
MATVESSASPPLRETLREAGELREGLRFWISEPLVRLAYRGGYEDALMVANVPREQAAAILEREFGPAE